MPVTLPAHTPPPGVKEPPHTVEGIVKELGPGLIVAGAIVGSGELIATTATGAEAGFWLMWLIIVGCVIKVFVQVEMGRYVICTGETSLAGMSKVPGPRWGRANWVLWFWLATVVVTTGQLGGIVGGVGQALAIARPITDAGQEYNRLADAKTEAFMWMAEMERELPVSIELGEDEMDRRIAIRHRLQASLEIWRPNAIRLEELKHEVKDPLIWAGLVALASTVLLVWGRYGFIQAFVTAMVGLFTLMTVLNVMLLQLHPTFAMQPGEFLDGMSFRLPPRTEGMHPVATALATFGIIGVAAGEMVFYPYWCQEKGYARFVGPDDGTGDWVRRARGWMRVLRWDAFGSMVVYSSSTVAFYILGAAILNRIGLAPRGADMVRTLGVMYEPVFGGAVRNLFLLGAVAVLYSTFFVTNASKARMCTDALRLFGLRKDDEVSRRRWLRIFCLLFPLVCFAVYWFMPQPTRLVLAGGVMQGILLPVMACTAIYFRYRFCDPRLAPGRGWDFFLWLSGAGMLLAGGWLVVSKLFPVLKSMG